MTHRQVTQSICLFLRFGKYLNMFTSRQRLKKVLVTPEKRKKFENGWNEYCFNFKYCNRWSFLILIAGSF